MEPFTITDAAFGLGISVRELVARIEAGAIKCVIFQGEPRVPRDEITRLAKNEK